MTERELPEAVRSEISPERGEGPASRPDHVLEPALPGLILCARCGQVVTSEDRRTRVDGAHVHRRTNLLGWEFEIGCFTVAPGVRPIGEETSEHTWFVGRTWRIEICVGCETHLGWLFEGPGEAFHALVLDRLTEGDPGGSA